MMSDVDLVELSRLSDAKTRRTCRWHQVKQKSIIDPSYTPEQHPVANLRQIRAAEEGT